MRRPPVWVLWLVGWGALAFAYLWIHDQDVSAVVYDVFPLAAVVAILIGLRRHRPARPGAWRLLAAGILLLAVGDIAYSWLEINDALTYPSIADGAYLASYVGIASAVFFLFRRSGGGRGALIDTAVFVVAGGLVLWALVIAPSLDPEASLFAVVVALAYPAMDLVLVALVVRLLMSSAQRPTSINLIAVALALFLAADVLFALQAVAGTYDHGVVDLGWLFGYTLWGTAALHPSMVRSIRQSRVPAALTPGRLVLLAATAAIGPGLLFLQGTVIESVDAVPVATLSGAMFVLIVARLAGIVRGQRLLLEERSRLQQTLRRQAVEDPLTDLPNRRGFLEAVSVALSRASVHTAVLFIDLDGFKMINDAHGHLAGDAVLRVIGQRLLHALREGDRVGRLGGDEFAVLLRDCPSDQAAIGFARRLLVALSAPTVVLGQTVQPTASIGIAMGTEGASADSMIRDADLAMYRAKALGKNRSEIFSASLYRDALRALVIRRDMADALAAGQLELVFQPILSLVSGRIQGFEALVRWFHPELGLVAPLEFIGLAEGSGTILPIGRWVLHEACTSAAGWQMPGSAPIGVSVNLSPIQLASADVLTDVRAALDSSGLDPRLLTLEMAEATIEDPEFVSERLSALREWGVKISIDDFGTGFSALSRVGGLPIQELKVDRSLIDQGDDKMAAAVIQLGKALGLRLIAEGVETREQLDRMRALGCDGAQGFLLGHPVAQSAVASVVLANRANPLAARGPVAMPIPALSG